MTIARVIDYETTGTPDDDHAEVIEMGCYDVSLTTGKLLTESAWSSLCRPRGPIPAVTKAVHHIIEDDVRGAPEARDLWDRLLGDLPADGYAVAHNAKFEIHFTPPWGLRWIDTYKVARVVWPDAPTHSNQGLRYWLELPCSRKLADPPHRALPDAYVTALLFCRLLEEKSPEEMAKISEYPALLKVMNFGKYRKRGVAMTFEQCAIDDPKYLIWIRDDSEMDEDTKFTAKYWLRKRGA
jgi:exodeoxyribonuclease X